MDVRGLEIFIEVAELRSFTRAGERLGYSQPTVSFQIRQLEQELGVPLFDRIGHTVSLTDAGREALLYAHRICNLSREMTLGAKQDSQISGSICIGMADSLCEPLIATEFGRFRGAYPQVSLKICNAGTDELIRMLDRNEVDMVCTLDSHVYNTAYVIASEEEIGVHFVVSPENRLAKLETVTLEQLLEQPFLLTEKGMSYARILEQRLAARSIEICPVLETGRADVLCGLVEQDMGVSFLPDYVTEISVRSGKLKRLRVEDFETVVWKQLLYRRDKWVSPQMKVLLSHLSCISLRAD